MSTTSRPSKTAMGSWTPASVNPVESTEQRRAAAPPPDPVRAKRRPSRRSLLATTLVVLLGAGIAAAANGWVPGLGGSSGADASSLLLHTVVRGPLEVAVTEKGTVESANNIEIRSQVEGLATIIYIVPEGTYVNQGDRLIELDSAALRDERVQQEALFQQARAVYEQAQQALEIQIKQNESDIAAAELAVELAKLDRVKYLDTGGDYDVEISALQNEIVIAEEDLTRARERLNWSQRVFLMGFISKDELESDRLAVKKAESALQGATDKLNVLEKYTYERQKAELEHNAQETVRELERVRSRAESALSQARADVEAAQATFTVEQAKLDKLNQQIANCLMLAPQEGMVVYANDPQNRRREEQIIEEGTQVRERQKIILLPDLTLMQVSTKVHESRVNQVRIGQPAKIRVDALPDRMFTGRVTKVNVTVDQSQWWAEEVKQYTTIVSVDEVVPLGGSPLSAELSGSTDLRPGMTAEVQIHIDQVTGVLSIPVQAVVRQAGQTVCFVSTPDGRLEKRPIQLGLTNDKFVEVVTGLEEGEKVVLNPGVLVEEFPRPEGDAQEAPTERDEVAPSDEGPRDDADQPPSQPDEQGTDSSFDVNA